MANPINCLICNSDLNVDPLIINGYCNKINTNKSQFQQGLQLLCKLLKINRNHVDKILLVGGKDKGGPGITGIPCCAECGLAFEQMLRLQQAIDLMQANLMKEVERVTLALEKSVQFQLDYQEDPLKIPPDDIFGKIRDQLLSCVRNFSTPPASGHHKHQSCGRSKPGPKSSKSKLNDSVISKQVKECQPCSVILERLPHSLSNDENEADITIKQEIISFDDPDTSFSNHVGDCGRRQVRKSKLKAFEFIRKNTTPQKPTMSAKIKDDVPSPGPFSPTPSNNHDDNSDDEEEYPWESEAEPISEMSPLPIQIKSSGRVPRRQSKFSLISPDILLYQYTLIKVSQGHTHFTCQEPGCNAEFSDASLNWNNLFNQMTHHIKQFHIEPSTKAGGLGQRCPICPKTLLTGPKLRAHLVGCGKKHEGHRIETVVCEVCWRPLRNIADFYRCHLWDHKNDQEKAESPEGPPPTLLSRAKRFKEQQEEILEKSRKLKNLETSKAHRKLKMKIEQQKFILQLQKKTKINVNLKQRRYRKPKKENKIKNFEGKPREINDNFSQIRENSPKIFLPNSSNGSGNEEDNTCESESQPITEELKDNPNSKNKDERSAKIGKFLPRGIHHMKINEHFCRLLENSREYLLLHKYTLVKAFYGVSLTCQEINCDLVINGTDFLAFEQFKNHVKTFHPVSQKSSDFIWKCPLCSEDLQTAEGYRYHLLFKCASVSTPVRHSKYLCTVCWRPLTCAKQLDYHQWLHKSELEKESLLKKREEPVLVQIREKEKISDLKCRHCQKRFNCTINLKAHEATHLPRDQRRKYGCPQCSAQFLAPVAVRIHVETVHQRELIRMRACPICNKQFNVRAGHAFRRHLKSHRNERDFVCDICGKAFLDGNILKRHRRRVHPEGKSECERRWQCEFCEMNYKESAHLKRHKRSAHKDKVEEDEVDDEQKLKFVLPEYRPGFIGPRIAFPCPVCERVFPLRSRMKKHYEKCCKQ